MESIKKILDVVKNRLEGEETEITFEMNPNDVSTKKIDGLLMAGVNRISLGVQSYHDQELKALGRVHDSDSILEAKKILQDTNTTIDLMYGIENQTSESFASNLKKTSILSPEGTNPVNSIVPPFGKEKGYKDSSPFAKPAHDSEPDGTSYP